MNPDGVLLPNMYAEVEIGTGDAASVVARLFYVAMSRATHQLTIVTDSDAPLVHLSATSVAGE